MANRAPDFLLANDAWARFINLRSGPDGNAYLIDWYDQQACHHNNPSIWNRSNGRVFKISYDGTKPANVDLAKLSDAELVKLQLHENDWYVRHARRLLQERGAIGVHAELDKIAFEHKDETRRLRGLWALHAAKGLTPERVSEGLANSSPWVRAWTVQLALEGGKIPFDGFVSKLAAMAKGDPSPVVRLYLASAAQRLPLESRWELVRGLIGHAEDANDHNLPLMSWYAMEPLAEVDAGRALHLASHSEFPQTLAFMARRISTAGTPEALAVVVGRLAGAAREDRQRPILQGLLAGLKGRGRLPMPEAWPEAYKKLSASSSAEVRSLALAAAVGFGDKQAFGAMRATLADPKAALPARRDALQALIEGRDPALPPVLQALAAKPALQMEAIQALASFDDPKTPQILLDLYPSLNLAGKRAVVNTLASRAGYGAKLLDAVAAKAVPAADLQADVVRQLRNLNDKALDQRIADVWGVVRTTPAERQAQIKSFASMLKRPKAPPDAPLGRALHNKMCAKCHLLFGEGGKVGPDITGANRGSLEYLLENVLDPSAVIQKEYAMTVLHLLSGRVVSGIVKEENDKTLTVVTQDETLTIAKKDVEKREASSQSMMPEDQLKPLSEHEIHSLFAYLQSPVQVPALATAENAKDLFNGKDLTGWAGDPKLWRVEDGEIVGKTSGLKRNEFLRSKMVAADFRLALKVKLTPNKENSGIQFRSEELAGGEVKGPQADVGAGWWGKLYEEHGRGLLWKEPGEQHVNRDGWNDYVIEAVGSRVKTWINGKPCVDLDDAKLSRRGIFAFQLHSGGATEVRYKDLKLEVFEKK